MTARPPAALPAPAPQTDDAPPGQALTHPLTPAQPPAPCTSPSTADATTLAATPAEDRPACHRSTYHRTDGWTPERQRLFVEGIAGGDTVDRACARVALSPASAYAFRRRAAGAAFALAWDGARLLARETLADTLLTRALEGQEEVITRPDGSVVTRHRFDNRLATHMLHRLDRFSDASGTTAHGTAARAVAAEFDAYLDLLDADATPARAGLFVARRLSAPDARASRAADLEPVLALARADRWLAGQAATAGEVDVSDLDPATRASWTAEQWARAEAAGLLALAPAPAPARDCQLSQLPLGADAYIAPADRPEPVWWCERYDVWRTRFPPPDGFLGREDGSWGDPDYERELDEEEIEQIEAPLRAHDEARRVTEGQARDRWFAEAAAEPFEDAEGHGEEPASSTDSSLADTAPANPNPDESTPADPNPADHPGNDTTDETTTTDPVAPPEQDDPDDPAPTRPREVEAARSDRTPGADRDAATATPPPALRSPENRAASAAIPTAASADGPATGGSGRNYPPHDSPASATHPVEAGLARAARLPDPPGLASRDVQRSRPPRRSRPPASGYSRAARAAPLPGRASRHRSPSRPAGGGDRPGGLTRVARPLGCLGRSLPPRSRGQAHCHPRRRNACPARRLTRAWHRTTPQPAAARTANPPTSR